MPLGWINTAIYRSIRKSTKAIIDIVVSVRLPGYPPAWNNSVHWKDFHLIWYFRIFRKPVYKIQVSLKPDKNYRISYNKTN